MGFDHRVVRTKKRERGEDGANERIRGWIRKQDTHHQRAAGGRVLFDWSFDVCAYPDWWEMVDSFYKQRGVKVLTYFNPFLTTSAVNNGCERRESRPSMFAWASKQDGYLIRKKSTGAPVLALEQTDAKSATFDFSNPHVVSFVRDQVLRCLLHGLREFCDESSPWQEGFPPANSTPVFGYMADFGEHLPLQDVELYSNESAMEWHNAQSLIYAQLTESAIKGTRIEAEGLPFHRSGTSTTGKHVRTWWAGDQEATWMVNDGFASLLKSYISVSLSSWGNIHSDIGGMIFFPVLSVRSEELLLRWLEFSAFADPLMRSHPSNGQEHVPQPYSSPELLNATRRLTKLHVALKQYKRQLLEKHDGTPMARHTLFCCSIDMVGLETSIFASELEANVRTLLPARVGQVDSATFETLASQLMVGEDVVVVPVLSPGSTSVSALVPPECSCADEIGRGRSGTWQSIWNSSLTFAASERVTLDAPLGQPAVLVRKGSAVAQTLLKAVASLDK